MASLIKQLWKRLAGISVEDVRRSLQEKASREQRAQSRRLEALSREKKLVEKLESESPQHTLQVLKEIALNAQYEEAREFAMRRERAIKRLEQEYDLYRIEGKGR
jgi:hypothetical protein